MPYHIQGVPGGIYIYICTNNCFNIKQLYIFLIVYIYVYRVILTANSDFFFAKQYCHIVCVTIDGVWVGEWIY
jgi:hypothetical protein